MINHLDGTAGKKVETGENKQIRASN